MDRTLTIVAVAAAGAYALAPRDGALATPPPGANAAARAMRTAMGSTVCGKPAPFSSAAGPLAIYNAQLTALTAALGRRVSLTRAAHVYPATLPLDCALAWGEAWRDAFVPWVQGAIDDFDEAWKFAVSDGRYGAVKAASRQVHLALVGLQRLAGRQVPDDFTDLGGGISLAEPLRRVFGDSLVPAATDNLVDAIRQLATEMENVYDEAATMPEANRGYWSIFADKLQTNFLRPLGLAAAYVGGAALGVTANTLAELVLSPVGAAAAAFVWWRYFR
jgi:hypothetical protein